MRRSRSREYALRQVFYHNPHDMATGVHEQAEVLERGHDLVILVEGANLSTNTIRNSLIMYALCFQLRLSQPPVSSALHLWHIQHVKYLFVSKQDLNL